MGNLTKKKICIISCIAIVLVSAVILHFAFKTKENSINNGEPQESQAFETVITVEHLLNTDEYITAKIPDNGTRYIKTINGIQTNDWIDVYPDGTFHFSTYRVNEKKCLEFIESEREMNVKQNWELTDVTEGKKVNDSYEAYYNVKGQIMHVIVINFSDGDEFFDYETGEKIPLDAINGY